MARDEILITGTNTGRTAVVAEGMHLSVRWGAIFAGAFVALLAYAALMALGMAVGGGSLDNVIRGEFGAGGFGIWAGIWVILSVIVSLFAGGYVAGRVGGLLLTRVGRIQGLVVAGLFFALMLSQLGSVLGTFGRGIGDTVGALGGAVSDVAGSSQVQGIVGDAIGDLNLKAPLDTVISGVISRLIQGREEAAWNYLAQQSGISREEAQGRIENIQAQFDNAVTTAATTAADALQAAGWILFGALLLGSLSAMAGGAFGAQVNLRSPLSGSDRKALEEQRAA